jgi:hypothetical protein
MAVYPPTRAHLGRSQAQGVMIVIPVWVTPSLSAGGGVGQSAARRGRFGLHFADSLGRALLDGRVEEVGEVRQSGTRVGRQIAERGGDL